MTGTMNDFGFWPVVDVIVMKDYGSPKAAPLGSSVVNSMSHHVRIEMIVPYDGDPSVANNIGSGNLDAAFQAILADNGYPKPPTTIDLAHARCFAVLAAAFGKFDGVIPGGGSAPRPPSNRPR